MTSVVLPAPLRPTSATTWPARTVKPTWRRTKRSGRSSYANPTSRNSTDSRRRGSATASGPLAHLAVRVEHREDAVGGRNRLLQAGVHAAELLDRAVHHERRGQKRREGAGREIARRDPAGPYQSAPTAARPPMNSMRGGSADRAPVIRMFVRYTEQRREAEPLRLPRLRAERLHDPVPGERLRAQVRQVLEFLLAAPRGPPHALPQPHQRIDDERRACRGTRSRDASPARTDTRRSRRPPSTRA